MKDIDFDELDRAVSSVLSQRKDKTDEQSAPDPSAQQDAPEATPPQSSDPVDVGRTDVDVDESAANNSETETPADTVASSPQKPAAPLAVKRRGKFMDVMHPSADMKPSSPTTHKPSRLAPPVTPLLEADNDDEPSVVVDPVDHSSEPTAVLDEGNALIGAEPAAAESTETISEPASQESITEPTETAEPAEDSISSPTEETPDGGEPVATEPEASPQQTPFLTDTQVEKRPLGAFGEAEAPADSEAPEMAMNMTEPATAPTPLPRELQPDVVKVESATDTEVAAAPGGAEPPSPFATQIAAAPDENDGRVEGHPLFDTSTYHEPIATVHHQAFPGWAKWTLGLLVCLAIGAGVGYFLFTAGL